MRNRYSVILLALTVCGVAICQSPTSTFTRFPVRVLNGRVSGGFNPSEPREMLDLLLEKDIQEELQLTDEQVKAAAGLKNKFRLVYTNVKPPTSLEEMKSAETAAREQANGALDEVITPAQRKRLSEIAMRSEVSFIGWPRAVSQGRLSDLIGVTDNQRTHLNDKASKIVKDAELKILRIQQEVEKAILLELSTEQRSKAEETFGSFYFYRPSTGLDMLKEFVSAEK